MYQKKNETRMELEENVSKKYLIKRWKNGEEFSMKKGCWSVGKLLRRYLTKRTCKLNSQQRREIMIEVEMMKIESEEK